MKKIKPTIIFIIFIGSFFIVSNILAMSIEVISPQFIIPGETRVSVFGRDFGEEFNYGTLYMEGTRITKANWTDTKISFNAPLDINPGRIEVKQSDGSGGYSEIVHSNYYYLQPAIDSFSPKSGAVGDIITIKGRNLENVFPKNVYPISMQIYVGGTTVGKQNILTWGNNKIVIKVPSGAKSGKIEIRIKADNSIVEIKGSSSENFKVLEASANDPLSPYQEYLHRVKIRDAWDYSVGTYDITVAVIDSGIYIHHPDLKDNIWKNTKEIEGNNVDDDKNGYIDDIFGWNFVDNNNQMDITFDKDDHGTMVAGIIGAKNNNYIGISGINKYVKLMPLLILSKYKSADFDEVAKAIKYAVDNGADIINLSFGTQGTVGYTTALDNAIKYAYENNVLLVAAAGNGDVETGSGQDLNFVKESPVCNDNNKNMVLGVGALSDNDFVSKTNWSNYGTYIDIWAPGENILTTSKPEYSNYQLDYFYGDGTSFAAPIVSGIAALIKAKYPDIVNAF